MSSLSDAERDASDAVRALAGLSAMLNRSSTTPVDPELDEIRRTLLALAENGGNAAVRVLAYLRMARGAGDGEAVAVPPRLGLWRDWVPPRGHVFGRTVAEPRIGGVHPRRCDPGE